MAVGSVAGIVCMFADGPLAGKCFKMEGMLRLSPASCNIESHSFKSEMQAHKLRSAHQVTSSDKR